MVYIYIYIYIYNLIQSARPPSRVGARMHALLLCLRAPAHECLRVGMTVVLTMQSLPEFPAHLPAYPSAFKFLPAQLAVSPYICIAQIVFT